MLKIKQSMPNNRRVKWVLEKPVLERSGCLSLTQHSQMSSKRLGSRVLDRDGHLLSQMVNCACLDKWIDTWIVNSTILSIKLLAFPINFLKFSVLSEAG